MEFEFIIKYKLKKLSKDPYIRDKTLDVFDDLKTAIKWAKQIYKENNGMFDTSVYECKYTSTENLKKDFAYMTHLRWSSSFNEI